MCCVGPLGHGNLIEFWVHVVIGGIIIQIQNDSVSTGCMYVYVIEWVCTVRVKDIKHTHSPL